MTYHLCHACGHTQILNLLLYFEECEECGYIGINPNPVPAPPKPPTAPTAQQASAAKPSPTILKEYQS